MQSLQDIKIRLGAVNNVGKITRAMEMVASTKMRRAQEIALASRPYAFEALGFLEKLTFATPLFSPLQETREAKKTLVVIMASDKGLTGSFNAQVLRAADKFFESGSALVSPDNVFEVAAVGKKAEIYARKRGLNVVKSFFGAGDYTSPTDSSKIADFFIDYFLRCLCDRVIVLSMHFRTALRQDVIVRQVLPAEVARVKETLDEILPERGKYSGLNQAPNVKSQMSNVEYIFEPSRAEVLNFLFPYLIRMQFYHLLLEANASEHSARRVAMKMASDNAEELAGKLTLEYNTARQAGITKEIIEITSTKNAIG